MSSDKSQSSTTEKWGCGHLMITGESKGDHCTRDVYSDGLCHQCYVREEFMDTMKQVGHAKGQCLYNDPYNDEKCERPSAYRGYCLTCLGRQ